MTVQYEYKILNVTLLNRGVDYVARNSGLTDDQLQRYEVTLECRGNRDDLFAGIAFATPDGAGSSGEYQDYDIPGEALTDEKFPEDDYRSREISRLSLCLGRQLAEHQL